MSAYNCVTTATGSDSPGLGACAGAGADCAGGGAAVGVAVVTRGPGVTAVIVGAAVTLRVCVTVTCTGGEFPGELHAAAARPSAAVPASTVMARFIAPPGMCCRLREHGERCAAHLTAPVSGDESARLARTKGGAAQPGQVGGKSRGLSRCVMLEFFPGSGNLTAAAVIGVAVVAAVVSYEHAHDLVRAHGEAGWTAASDSHA